MKGQQFSLILMVLCASCAREVDSGVFENLLHTVTSFFTNTRSSELGRWAPPEEAFMSTPRLIRHHGYPVEEHKVKTEDGYIVTVFRIPHGKNASENEISRKEPVLLYHGFLLSSDDWLLLPSSEDNLPYLLANDGHDVWLGNVRGNHYSMDDTIHGVKSNSSKYYNFGLDEISLFDFPAVLAYVLKVSNAPQLSYIGHSLGGFVVSFALSEKPELNRMVRKIVLLAPPLYTPHATSLLYRLNGVPNPVLQEFSESFTGGRIIPARLNSFLKKNSPYICTGQLGPELCDNFIFLINGYDRDQITNKTRVLISGHSPSPSATKIFVHTTQINTADSLRKFDYGANENRRRYGQAIPPTYNLSKVQVPVLGLYGENDLIVTVQDALRGLNEFPNLVGAVKVNYKNFTHVDFLYAKDVKYFVYDQVVDFLSI